MTDDELKNEFGKLQFHIGIVTILVTITIFMLVAILLKAA